MKKLTIAFILAALVAFGQPVVSNNPPLDTNYLPNDGSTGTTLGQWLVMNTSGNAVNAPTTVASGVRGLCVTGCGTTGMAGFISRGVWPALLDNSGVAGNWVIPSTTTAGKGHDTGSATRPTSGVVLGQVQGAATGGMYYVVLDPPDTVAASGGGVASFNTRTGAVTGAAGDIPVTINAQTGTTYTVVAGDNGKLVTFNNASPVAVTLPQATGSFGAGWWVKLKNIGAGTVTITPTTSTLMGASSITLGTGEWVDPVSDGANYGGETNRLIQGSNVTLTKAQAGTTVDATGSGSQTATTGAWMLTPFPGHSNTATFYSNTPSGYKYTPQFTISPTAAYIDITTPDTGKGITLTVYNNAGTTKIGEWNSTATGSAATISFTITGLTMTGGTPYLITLSTDSNAGGGTSVLQVAHTPGTGGGYPGHLMLGATLSGRCSNGSTGTGASITGPATCGTFNASDSNAQYYILWKQ